MIYRNINLTIRDHFAIAALQGMLSNPKNKPGAVPMDAETQDAYRYADYMLAERELPANSPRTPRATPRNCQEIYE